MKYLDALGFAALASCFALACQPTAPPEGGAGGGGGAPAACPGALLSCGEVCVDARFDLENCGMCGTACAAGEVCSQGKCGVECSGGTSKCEVPASPDPGAPTTVRCVDLNVDSAHCGGCGLVCGAGNVCSAGKCGSSCVGGTTLCGNVCTNTLFDPANCGMCGNACVVGANTKVGCATGSCITACTGSFLDCNDLDSDGCEVAPVSDVKNCGGCNKPCAAIANGTVTCSNAACAVQTCNATFGNCDKLVGNGCEASLLTDSFNCAFCGNACGAGKKCDGGVCVQASFTSCLATLQGNGSTGDGLYMIDPDGEGGAAAFQVYCDMTSDGGGYTRCLEFVNTAAEDVNNNTWFDNCVDWSMASWTGTDLYVKLKDADANVVYAQKGSRNVAWIYDQITSTTGNGNQYDASNHNQLVTLANGDKLMIAGRNSNNGGCGGSMGNGYGIVIYPMNPNYYSNPKMFVFPYRQQVGGAAPRSFGNWSVNSEISYFADSFDSCNGVKPFIGSFDVYVR